MPTKPSVAIIDVGLGNLSAIRNLLYQIDCRVKLCNSPDELKSASHVILPGVGSASEALRRLLEARWDAWMATSRQGPAKVIGICLGAQLLVGMNQEAGREAFGLAPGRTISTFPPYDSNTGWRRLDHEWLARKGLASGLESTDSYYFNHCYKIDLDTEVDACYSVQSPRVVAAFSFENLIGIQFHPEKSQTSGAHFLRNVIFSD